MPPTVDSSLVSQGHTSGNAPAAMDAHSITPPMPLRTLIVDNYDSYTFNLLQLFTPIQLESVVVIHNDQFAWPHFEEHILPYFDQIILSPGPGRPERATDFGICTQILQTTHIPVFGVCLGHQGIGWMHGATVTYGAEPVHGQIAHIQHDNTGLFQDIPQEFEAVRYHSLVVQEQDLPADLIPTAWCYSFPLITPHNLPKDRTSSAASMSVADQTLGSKSIMGLRHRTLPHHGVQFHPESICTQYGRQMMDNFFRISYEFYAKEDLKAGQDKDTSRRYIQNHKSRWHSNSNTLPDCIRAHSVIPTRPQPSSFTQTPAISHFAPVALPATSTAAASTPSNQQSSPYSLLIHALDPAVFPEPEAVFSSLFLTGPRSNSASWWLDSARQPHPMSRFSFMGGVDTRQCHEQEPYGGRQQYQPLAPESTQAVIQYSTLHKEIRVRRYHAHTSESSIKQIRLGDDAAADNFWDWMSHVMADFTQKGGVETILVGSNGEQRELVDGGGSDKDVPFDFFAGMIGYFGYEMKRESMEGYHIPVDQQCHCLGHGDEEHAASNCDCDCLRQPDASFMLATQAVVFDHVEKRVYVLGIVNNQSRDGTRVGTIQQEIGAAIGFSTLETCQDWIQNVTRSILRLATPGYGLVEATRRKSPVADGSGLTTNDSKKEPYLVKQRHRRQSSASLLSPFKVDVTEEDYLAAIRESLNNIHEGESYELCLTTQFRTKLPLYLQHRQEQQGDEDLVQGDPAYDLYKILRKLNPAPFSAFLSMPTALAHQNSASQRDANEQEEFIGKLIILSSSPERFLKIGKAPSDETSVLEAGGSGLSALSSSSPLSRTVEMKPIKGTVAVAKGCFCQKDEGCAVDDQDSDSSGHADDEDYEQLGQRQPRSATEMQQMSSAERERRRLTTDRCAEARRREDQRRVESLSKNIKERAENLMIVDLIRNDLAHVCSSKSVRVPYLMHVESYETVHQLVTTVRGELFDHIDNTKAVRACFPPGSMTGAPKLRSVQLLDSLEHHSRRGVYSGCLGYISIPVVATAVATIAPNTATTLPRVNKNGSPRKVVRSAVDLAVVIRTAVISVEPSEDKDGVPSLLGDLSVGAGGALTILSDANEEWREVLLKSRSVVPSVLTYLHQNAV